MAVPALSLSTESPLSAQSPLSATADLLVLGVWKTPDGPRLASDDASLDPVREVLAQVAATGSADELRRLPALVGAVPIALIGLGAEPSTPAALQSTLRDAAGSATRQLTGIARLALALPVASAADATSVLEGAGIGAYSYTGYRVTSLDATKTPASAITAHMASAVDTAGAVDRAVAIVTAVHTVRDLVNTPPSDLYPESLASAAAELAKGLPVEVEVLDETELAAEGYGGILGVGSGSTRPPRLVTVRYSPSGATRHLSLVGKGITFDSGGLSIKPPSGMVGMKYDMTGAVTVLAVVLAVARLGLPVRVTARLCIAENMPSGSAMRPNDVLHIHGGTTVEVLNTDAEGRLVLADGIAAASEEHPDAIIDVATLTGTARTALGERYIPVMGDEPLAAQLVAAGATVGEVFWPMPLPPELRHALDSDVADLVNQRPGNTAAGMLVAGLFLKQFVGSNGEGADAAPIPWAHLDIAGVANNSVSPYGMVGKGPTGATVRTLIALSEVFSRP